MKFKVGDKVKVVDCKMHGSRCSNVGKIFTIRKIVGDNGEYLYLLEGTGEYFGDNELIKLQEKQFTKADLEDGDKCTLKNGQVVFVDKTSKYSFGSIDEQLSYYPNDDVSIVKVERPVQYKTVFERKEEILDETEKRYLANIIRPFREKVGYIIKYEDTFREYIAIILKNEHISLPFFHKGTMYKGMKEDKEYTLKELGL